jgi:hypothetical protein
MSMEAIQYCTSNVLHHLLNALSLFSILGEKSALSLSSLRYDSLFYPFLIHKETFCSLLLINVFFFLRVIHNPYSPWRIVSVAFLGFV